jgi:hypothetical protein
VAAVNANRPHPIRLKCFQYLDALYTEIYLDRRANACDAFLRDLNEFVAGVNVNISGMRWGWITKSSSPVTNCRKWAARP